MLPKIDVVTYDIELPLTKQKVTYRPFLVKEEKILLMAMESDDDDSMLLAIKQIVNNCCISPIDISKLPTTDLEYLFINLRARSVGESVDLEYKCNNHYEKDGENVVCDNIIKLSVNLLEIGVEKPIPDNRIQLTESIGVVMRFPTMESYEKVDPNKTRAEMSLDVVIDCIECVYDEENAYYTKDSTREEVVEFLESLTKSQFEKIENFFENIPSVETTLKFHCPKCGNQKDILVTGAQSFFV